MYVCMWVCVLCVLFYPIVFVITAPEKDRDSSQLEVKIWEPNQMSDYKVEQFLVVARFDKLSIILDHILMLLLLPLLIC